MENKQENKQDNKEIKTQQQLNSFIEQSNNEFDLLFERINKLRQQQNNVNKKTVDKKN